MAFYRKHLFALIFCSALAVIASIVFYIRFTYISLDYTNDYTSYLDTSRFIAGQHVEIVPYHRLIKPLQPLITTILQLFTGSFEKAFFVQVFMFYLLSIPVTFLLFKEFFLDNKFAVVASTSLFIFGYPMIRFGLDPFIETGAWFFYMLALFFCIRFMRQPQEKWVWYMLVTTVLGFFYKEYSILPYLVFNLILFLIPDLEKNIRRRYFVVFNIWFLAIHAVWQAVIFFVFKYTYFTWYVEGGIAGAPVLYHLEYLKRSFFAVLIAGWPFVLASGFSIKKLQKIQKIFLSLALITSGMCLVWGSVSARLFYVTAPGLIVLAVLGIDYIVKYQWLKYVVVVFIVLINFVYLFKGGMYVF